MLTLVELNSRNERVHIQESADLLSSSPDRLLDDVLRENERGSDPQVRVGWRFNLAEIKAKLKL